jgi:hypothetical protein
MACFLLAIPVWGGPLPPSAKMPGLTRTGCVHGSRRVGTLKDAALGRRWAVVVNCAHPAWPAHLEPVKEWSALPLWVPAGTGIEVRAENGHMAMHLSGTTVMPGRVGDTVEVQLRGGSRVEARLQGGGLAALVPRHHWGQP